MIHPQAPSFIYWLPRQVLRPSRMRLRRVKPLRVVRRRRQLLKLLQLA
jgi:hypothetical protein